MAWSARPVMPAGHIVTADDLDAILDQIELSASSWSTWTPTLTNITQGNGTVVARYKQVGSTIDYRFKFTLGTTSAVGTSPRFSLPVAPLGSYVQFHDQLGVVDMADTGTANRRGVVFVVTGSTAEIYNLSTTGVVTVTTATVPHTWATTDVIVCSGRYESA